MRRISVFVTSVAISFVMALSGLAFSPAHASALADGSYLCSTGEPTSETTNVYTIAADVVSSSSCVGAVVIPEGVNSIGGGAFQYTILLTAITIPASVVSISDYAFNGSHLSSITFSEGSLLASIGRFAFFETTSLTAITIPAGVVSIDSYAFMRSSLNAITIPASVTSIGALAFKDSLLSFVTFENGSKLTTIDNSTFRATSLTTIIIPASVTSIGEAAFANSTIASIIFENGSQLNSIGNDTFRNTSLTTITIPASVVSIGTTAFASSNSLSSIYFLGNAPTVGNDAFADASKLRKVLVNSAYASTFTLDANGKWNGLTVGVPIADGSYLCSTGEPTSETTEVYTITTVGSDVTVSDGGTCTGAVVIREGVTAISAGAFQNATSLTAITIPASVTDVGAFAFDGTSLNSITFGVNSQLTSIGAYAFYGQTALTSLAIPASATSIGLGAFQGAVSLNSITFGVNSQLTSIGVAAFSESTITSITIPASVNSIGDSAFQGANSLSSIYFLGSAPNSVGLGVFNDIGASPKAHVNSAYASTFTLDGAGLWNGLTVASYDHLVTYNSNGGSPVSTAGFTTGGTLSAPNAPTRDGYGFAGWSRTDGGAAVVFPYSPGGTSDVTLFAKWLVDGSYECTTGLGTTPQLPPPSAINTYPITNGVVVTNHSANGSNNCAGVVVISEGVTSIGDDAFAAASFMTDITFSASVTTIGNYAFYGATSLEDVTFASDSRLIAINNFAFQYATSLTSIIIPGSVTSIGGSAFGNASKLSNIYFLGNAPTVGEGAFTDIGEAPKAYVKNANVSSFTPLVDGKWNGLTVVIVDPPVVDPPVVDPPVVDPPVVPPSGITSDTAADLAAAKLAAGKLAAADLAARTVGKKKTFVAKTLAKRVGIKTVSSKATVTMSVSKSSKKICAVSKSKLMTLKGGKCLVTFTVQEPKPKKGKLPKATKTTKTLVVN